MAEFLNIEFHRAGYGMFPEMEDQDPGVSVCFPRNAGGSIFTGKCDCRESKQGRGCSHFERLMKDANRIQKLQNGGSWGEAFCASLWYRLASILSEGDSLLCPAIRTARHGHQGTWSFLSPQDRLMARLLDESEATLRFLERIGKAPASNRYCDRAGLIRQISTSLCGDDEKRMNQAGVLTIRQMTEQSFWGVLSYHCFREYGLSCTFHPCIEQSGGDFILKSWSGGTEHFLEIVVPRRQVRKTLDLLKGAFPGQGDLAIHPVPLKSIFLVTPNTKLDIEVCPAIQVLQSSGETRFLAGGDFAKFRYGDLVYLHEMNVLAELETPGSGRRFAAPVNMKLKKSLLPAFLDEHRSDLEDGLLVLDEPLRHLSILRDHDDIEIVSEALDRSWYWLSIRYGFGDESVSLADILRAKRAGQSYIPLRHGWIDVNAHPFATVDLLEKGAGLKVEGHKVRLSGIDMLRLVSSSAKPVRIKEEDPRAETIKRLLAFTPANPAGRLKGLSTPLRSYQVKGVDWLRFLYENGLSGLLCDDMGLGKTHQAMALMISLRERDKSKVPFLVVCPTTVISHWMNKIREHAPGLKPVAYYGGVRDLKSSFRKAKVLVTSYGVLRNDIALLGEVRFTLAVFDEIQNLKNRETQNYQAAKALQARMRIGLTGTPIENSLADLKALFDLVLPGYLGTDEDFAKEHGAAESAGASADAYAGLRRLIAPFVLRRLKGAVLEELPEKIEDLRTCELSDVQVKLYRDALRTKGSALVEQLRSGSQRLPYIHIFALLNLLKRICDHPALALNDVGEYQKYSSGKWDLFQELLFESIDSGQKVVVFSQYLGMISMMERLLADLGIGFATLTGASVDRGEIVRRFNEEAGCRVFLGSLKAGGAGIDLVAGSIVIHYDRWWNAAREDQATDRVHRIGQKRAVQVFKLVASGTLEEKISAIIERKRRLANSVVQADDPRFEKIFTREELIDILKPV
jgi:superfamily II DNA or RNA helicase